MTQTSWLDPKVVSHLMLFCIHRVKLVNFHNGSAMLTAPSGLLLFTIQVRQFVHTLHNAHPVHSSVTQWQILLQLKVIQWTLLGYFMEDSVHKYKKNLTKCNIKLVQCNV